MRVRAALRSIICSLLLLHLMSGAASAASAGLDTPSGVPALPIAVEGQTALTLNVDTSGATPPQPAVNFTGPINEGGATGTTITTAGQIGIGTTNTSIFLPTYEGLSSPSKIPGSNVGPNLLVDGVASNQYPAVLTSDNTIRTEVAVSNNVQGWGFVSNGTNIQSLNTGWGSPGDFWIDQWGWGPRLLIQASTGNVGIGTTGPQATLHVNGNSLIGSAATGETNVSLNAGGIMNTKEISIYYDTVSDGGIITALYQGVAYKALELNPNGGNVGIGTASPGSTLTVNGNASISGNTSLNTLSSNLVNVYNYIPNAPLVDIRNTSTNCYVWFGYEAYSLYAAGCSQGQASDARLKKDIAPLKSALDTVDQLNPVSFHWKENGYNGNLKNMQFGLIAQDVQKVIPELVSSVDHANDPKTPDQKGKPPSLEQQLGTTYMLDYQSLIPFALAAIKELKSLVDKDHDTLAKLKADNDNLRAANNAEAAEIEALAARLDKLESSHP